jgi:NAD(P)-dependent dehydrogenase (short-subunit alcohol dehydrogenase family)
VLGPLYCGAAAARAMRAQGRGVIVNIASLSLLGQGGAATYSASKGAIASMTFAWAAELAELGIRVNGVCPVAWTRMAEADTTPAASRADTPDKTAPLVTYLLSDLAAGVTGQLIRFAHGALHIVRQPALKEPVLRREGWAVADIALAFESELATALEPPPRFRWTT